MNKNINPALNYEALYVKSKIYISRGLRAKTHGDAEEYQLWASMALELLAKSSLSTIHPALVADPTHSDSLFAACGVPISPDIKTITAKTLFQRLGHISKLFDLRLIKFCEQLSLRRNSEIHSGESPFAGMKADAWEVKYWYAIEVILSIQNKGLDEWLGAEDSKAPIQILTDANNAVVMAVKARISHTREDFESAHKNPKERASYIKSNECKRAWEYWNEFDDSMEDFQMNPCPSCSAVGILGGVLWNEEVSDERYDSDSFVELIEKTYSAEEYLCKVCGLHLSGIREVKASNLPEEFVITEEREREFEPDYGND